ncbi:hypothetical protein Vadar_030229 [Vaccinium darrowii]|uniref:Uncharacterized protein n=1 Tax=Vaccinium darrowii TaxID=229202 RepID=A0ACB7Y3M7_9ERIC|nr:hypothetical protein Vadar_030229 [Vaccinium darrowii]
MLAGVNPVIISWLQEFPPTGNLDPKFYGNVDSSISRDHIDNYLDGLTIEEPLAIELSLPNPRGDQFGAISKVYTPAEDGVEASVWQLAKAYAAINDFSHHQSITHWLNTHAVIVLFVIATNRQLSVLHPIHKLLLLYFHDMMNIFALGRQTLINAGAIETWVHDYCYFYYKDDKSVQVDLELQSWWKELREEGHGDTKDKPWWPKMQTIKDLNDTCTIIIWVGSALHAAVNFGQYSYAWYIPNRPTISRRFMPELGSPASEELKASPEKAFLKAITAQLQILLWISSIEILSRHSSDEELSEIEDEIIEMNGDEKLRNRVGPVKVPYTAIPTSERGRAGRVSSATFFFLTKSGQLADLSASSPYFPVKRHPSNIVATAMEYPWRTVATARDFCFLLPCSQKDPTIFSLIALGEVKITVRRRVPRTVGASVLIQHFLPNYWL